MDEHVSGGTNAIFQYTSNLNITDKELNDELREFLSLFTNATLCEEDKC